MEEKKISTGTACVLVKDESLFDGANSSIYKWLRKEGFISWGRKGFYSGVNWIYINLTSKVYAAGMPGIPVTSVIGDHAITFDEFIVIYNIYKKYCGLDPLRMSANEQYEWNKKQAACAEENRKYWLNMTFDKYCTIITDILINQYSENPTEVSMYLKKEEVYLRNKFQEHFRPESTADEVSLMM